MKLIILSIVLLQVFTLNENPRKTETLENDRKTGTKQWYYWEPIYYYTSPFWDYWYDYYYFFDTYYFDWDWGYFYFYRKGSDDKNDSKTTKRKEFNLEEAKKELSQIKNEVWGNQDFSTEEIRKSKKAYDIKWILAQLKIAKVLELEDMIINPL